MGIGVAHELLYTLRAPSLSSQNSDSRSGSAKRLLDLSLVFLFSTVEHVRYEGELRMVFDTLSFSIPNPVS